ncbi:hypothetical protein [Fulvivirga sediminis]|uniref:Uncharacterized protein n=1 Tax=Fulvivirga sediminis TaxID=2803949 RepID=A0A937F3M7_9BACT|nr:hypothetical protein [Fulvivirga sediminis]MBL3655746.1 hypothetical protein [Fulvivirga sediminis]
MDFSKTFLKHNWEAILLWDSVFLLSGYGVIRTLKFVKYLSLIVIIEDYHSSESSFSQ